MLRYGFKLRLQWGSGRKTFPGGATTMDGKTDPQRMGSLCRRCVKYGSFLFDIWKGIDK